MDQAGGNARKKGNRGDRRKRLRVDKGKGAREGEHGALRRVRTWAGKPWSVPLVLGLVAAGLCGLFFNPLLSTIGDNAQYVVLGKSLLAGKGLSHINSPDQKPDMKYPFMFPLILAAVMAVSRESLMALKLVGVVACVGAAALYYPVFRKGSEPVVAVGAAVLAVLSPDILCHSSIILAEVPYLFVSFLALGWIALGEDRWPERVWVPVALALVMTAYYLKAVGIALAAGVFLVLLFRRKTKWAFGFIGGVVLLALPWALRSHRIGGGQTYFDYFLMKDPYKPYEGMLSAVDFLSRIGGNAKIYFYQIVPQTLVPFTGAEGASPGPAVQLLWLVVSSLTAVGLAYRLLRHRTVADLYLLGFLGICAVWPSVWASVRFIVPVIPLLFFCLLTGLWAILSWFTRRGWKGMQEGVVAGLAAVMVMGTLLADRAEARAGRGYSPDWKSYFNAAFWARDETPAGSVFVCRKPYLFYLTSGRRAMGYKFSKDPQEVVGGFREVGATHIVVDQFQWTGTSARYLVPAILSDPDKFPVVHVTEQEPRTIVMRFMDWEGEEEP
ncbi:MAG: hypothetical protein KAW17_01255 [Candidatus Eisenbacteria sp.]|nr:hypothetical protein [Candidatus Eisenbacteria bacterium]